MAATKLECNVSNLSRLVSHALIDASTSLDLLLFWSLQLEDR